MILRPTEWELAILVALCVAAVFFFPALHGPYSAVNGPVTALQAARAATRLRSAIVQAALTSFRDCRIPSLLRVGCTIPMYSESDCSDFMTCSSVLRC